MVKYSGILNMTATETYVVIYEFHCSVYPAVQTFYGERMLF